MYYTTTGASWQQACGEVQSNERPPHLRQGGQTPAQTMPGNSPTPPLTRLPLSLTAGPPKPSIPMRTLPIAMIPLAIRTCPLSGHIHSKYEEAASSTRRPQICAHSRSSGLWVHRNGDRRRAARSSLCYIPDKQSAPPMGSRILLVGQASALCIQNNAVPASDSARG